MSKLVSHSLVVSFCLVAVLFFRISSATASVSCTCNGSASINAAGQIAAAAAGYTQTTFASDCTGAGGTASGWTCSISNLTGPAETETQCTSATPASIAEMAGLPSSYSAFYSAAGSCRLTDDSSSSEASGWLTIVPLECQEKTGGCNICDITKVFTNAANLISAALSAIALLMFVVGGLFWIFSGGVETRVEMGKKIIIGTVTGLAIVFIAWFAVNVIVRTASLSGGESTTQLFSKKDWWSFEGCYPAVPTSCANLLTGDVCGNAGDCSGSSYDNPRCQCWRALLEDGDDKNCKTDGSVTKAEDGAKDQICACVDACRLQAVSTGKAYTCVAENSVATPAQQANYSDIRTDITCGVAGSVCVLPK